jgi:purine-binding chemotaxis protein CheW
VKRLATFTIDGDAFGVDVERVREVLRPQVVTPIPLAPPQVAGLINLRGEIVPALDLRVRLGSVVSADRRGMSLIVNGPAGPVSLLVDEVGEVLEVDDASLEPPPPTLREAARELIAGMYTLDDRLLVELDVARTIDDIAPSGTDSEEEG